jgi:DNA polymerase-3 subunit beta
MNILINKTELLGAISTVTRAIASRTTMDILEGIYIETVPSGLKLKCSDLSLQMESIIPASVEQDGSITVPGRLFSEFIRRLPEEQVEINTSDKKMNIKSGRSRTTLQGLSASDFPNMPPLNNTVTFEMPQNILKSMIRQTVFSIAQDETKPILTGALMQLEDGSFTIVALDGYRLAIRKENVVSDGKAQAVIPGRSLTEIMRTLSDGDEKVSVNISRTHVMLDLGFTKIVSRLLEGDFIKYKQILPSSRESRVQAQREELLESIERASLMARESKNNIIKLSFTEDNLNVSANSEMGNVVEDLPISLTGNDIDIAFNARYFTDVLKSLDDEKILLDFNNNVSPCIVKPIQGDAYLFLILPVRLFMN